MGSPGLARAIQAACDAGALVVIAAGNSGTNNDVIPTIPGCYRKDRTERIITVMATDRYDEKASFSNYGIRTVDLAAPGVGLVATRAALTVLRRSETG
jgi:thermitase